MPSPKQSLVEALMGAVSPSPTPQAPAGAPVVGAGVPLRPQVGRKSFQDGYNQNEQMSVLDKFKKNVLGQND